MEATVTGPNRTGTTRAPADVQLMLDAVDRFSPPSPISTLQIDIERQSYIAEAESVGSIPPTLDVSAEMRAEIAPELLSVFFDKLGERIAFERTGTRLYDALITKYLALSNAQNSLAGENNVVEDGGANAAPVDAGLEKLRTIRAEELGHFQMLSECVSSLGGDPTAQTPCADVAGTASAGLLQVITDPRTTLAQSLSAALTAELTDNAGWELLSELAEKVGQAEMSAQFERALQAEHKHLAVVRSWLESLVMNESGSPAV
jgi:ferritin-like metal-binding protein YciE